MYLLFVFVFLSSVNVCVCVVFVFSVYRGLRIVERYPDAPSAYHLYLYLCFLLYFYFVVCHGPWLRISWMVSRPTIGGGIVASSRPVLRWPAASSQNSFIFVAFLWFLMLFSIALIWCSLTKLFLLCFCCCCCCCLFVDLVLQ